MITLVKVSDVLASSEGVKPPSVIDTSDDSAAGYWAYRLDISPDELFAAIREVGPSVAAVRRYLNK
ncbi:MAG TPA: DUF3606 domain-containing protein [Afipia sp.]